MVPQPSFVPVSPAGPTSDCEATTLSRRANQTRPPAPARAQLDRIDRKILLALQQDATLSLERLANQVGLSQTPLWKRVQKLQQAGVITRRVALVDPARVGVGLTAFVTVAVSSHSPAWREIFAETTAAMPEVLEVWRMGGEADYLLKVVTPDMAGFDAFYCRLTDTLELKSVTSQFAMERMAYTTALPIPLEAI